MTVDDIGSMAGDTIWVLVGLLMTIASTVAQLTVVAHILRSREGGYMFLVLGLATPVFWSFASSNLRSLSKRNLPTMHSCMSHLGVVFQTRFHT